MRARGTGRAREGGKADLKGLDRVLPRIGRTSRDRLTWVVGLVQRRPGDMTPGDRENLRLELAAFTWLGHPLPGSYRRRLRSHLGRVPRGTLDSVPEGEIPGMLERLGKIIEWVVRRENFYPGGGPSGRLWLSWDELRQRWDAWLLQDLPLAELAAIALGHLIKEYGHLVKECPAPALRAKAGETCGLWFVAKRPNQEYCSATCQSRASTRASRAGTETPAMMKRSRKEG